MLPFEALLMADPGVAGLGSLWRVNITALAGAATVQARELEMRGVQDGPNLCVGGSANASSWAGDVPANAFDGSTANRWSATGGAPQWIEYQFPGLVNVEQIAMHVSGTADIWTAFNVQYWDGSAFQTYWSETARGQLAGWRKYCRHNPLLPGSAKWRVVPTARSNGSTSGLLRVDEFELRETPGGPNVTSPNGLGGSAIGNGTNNYQAFNGTASYWVSSNGTAGAQIELGWNFGTQKVINEIALTCSDTNAGLKTFSVQYWDGTAWVTSWSVADAGAYTAGVPKVFTKP